MTKDLYAEACAQLARRRFAKAVERSDREVARYKTTIMTAFDRHALFDAYEDKRQQAIARGDRVDLHYWTDEIGQLHDHVQRDQCIGPLKIVREGVR